MSVLKVTKEMFETELKTTDKVVMLDFYADWCGPCNMVAPLVAELAAENPDYCIGKVNVDDEPELARQFGVTTIPTLVILNKGEVVRQSIGALPKDKLEAFLKG
ncbi:MAG: thioredoxin [Treponema sp.]|nr:thioredoxin [Treponema sp.]